MLLFKDQDWQENALLLPKQCTCVDTKALMIKRDKPVEQA